ncbi:MAG: hypothetical protein NTY19_00860, partial [Planctomycetota bacterium]|nr:hypothetical protein [Planctomycetota bacterium]
GTGGLAVNKQVVTSVAGKVSLTVSNENDLVVGDLTAGKYIQSTGGEVELNAGGAITLNHANADVRSHGGGTTAGLIDVNADTNNSGVGTFTAVTGATLNADATATDGSIEVDAAAFNLAGTITAGSQVVHLAPTKNGAAAIGISLGAGAVGGTFGVSDTELDLITAGRIEIGYRAATGDHVASGAIAVDDDANPGFASTLVLNSSGTIGASGGTRTLTIGTLAFNANAGVGSGSLDLRVEVTTLTGRVTGPGNLQLQDPTAVTIDSVITDDGTIDGLTTTSGMIDIYTINGAITVNKNITAVGAGQPVTLCSGDSDERDNVGSSYVYVDAAATISSAGWDLSIVADRMALNGLIQAPTRNVNLAPYATTTTNPAGVTINLGGADAFTAVGDATVYDTVVLGLTDAELDNVTAVELHLGNTNRGPIVISSAIDTANTNVTWLQTAGTVTQTASITESTLVVSGPSGVTLTNAGNDVGTISISTTSGDIAYWDKSDLIVTDISTNSGSITVVTGVGGVTGNLNLIPGNIVTLGVNKTIDLRGTNFNDGITVGANSKVQSNNGKISLGFDNVHFAIGQNAKILAGTNVLEIRTLSTATTVVLGTVDQSVGNGQLKLCQGEFDDITAVGGVKIEVSSTSAASIDVVGAVFLATPGNAPKLYLKSAGGIRDSGSAYLTFDSLELSSGGNGIGTSSSPLLVNTSTLAATAAAGDVYITESNGMSVGAVTVGMETVTGLQTTGAGNSITLNVNGNLALTEAVTTNAGFAFLQATGGITSTAAGTITTTGATAGAVGGAVDINAGTNVSLVGSITTTGANNGVGGAGGIVTIDTTNGPISVGTITTTGGTGTGGNGGAAGLMTLNTGVNNTITLNGNLTAAGGAGSTQGSGADITLSDPTVLGASLAISTGATTGNIQFAQTLDSTANQGYGLTLTAGTGNISFSGAVGAGLNGRLGAIAITSAKDVTESAGITAASLVQSAGTGMTLLNGAVNTSTGTGVALTTSAVTVNNTITTSGGGTVTITNAGLLDIAVAADMNLDGAFLQNGAGAVQTAGDITTTADSIYFTTGVTLTDAHAVAFSTGAGIGTITFHSTLDGTTNYAEDLSLTAGTGSIDFDGIVGGTKKLGDVVIASALDVTADFAFSADTLTQTTGTGDTQFDGVVTLHAAGGVALTTNTVTINAAVNTLA